MSSDVINGFRRATPLDPFYRARHADSRFGADMKYLLTSNITLDATINPDFGRSRWIRPW
jgi:hypothetical protein